MSEIKNCPFCGKEPSLHRDTHDGSWRGFMLTCTNDNCDINPSTRLHKTRLKAIGSWNKRKACDEFLAELIIQAHKNFIKQDQMSDEFE